MTVFPWWLCFVLCVVQDTGGVKLENLTLLFQNNVSVMELLIPTLNSENPICREHSEYYLRELKGFRLWAAEMMDATAKFPSGVLHGSTYNLGNFDQCLEIKVPYGNGKFSGKYCLAKFTVKPPAYIGMNHNVDYIHDDYTSYFNISTWEKIAVFSQDESKASRNDLYISFCLPSSCTNEDLKNSLFKVINDNNANDFEVTIDVERRNCETDEKAPFTKGDIAFIAVLGATVMLVALSSTYHLMIRMENMNYYKASHRFHAVIMCFSFPHNLKKLASKSKNEDGLDCVSGMKTLSMFLIIFGHRCMFTFGSPMTNPRFLEEMYTKIEATICLNGPIIVDTFFVISGFLAAYLTIHFFEKQKFNYNVFMLYLHRIIRILPSYGIVLAFYCTLFVKIGSGPFWQERVGLEQERCLENWWANLLYINNYVNVDKLCMFQSWYLTCDIHYFLLMPPLVWLLKKNQTAGILTIGGIIIASMISVFVTVYISNETGIMLLYMKLLKDPVLNNTFRKIYIPTHLRASPYFVGIIAAYIKYKMKVTDYKMPRYALYVGWIVSLFMVTTTIFTGFVFYIPGYSRDIIFSTFYASVHHLTFSLCMAWVIIAVSSGNGSWIKPILSWKPLILLSRITYTAFLSHGAIQIITSSVMRVPRYVSVFTMIYDTFADITYAYIIGFVLSMYFEAPILGLEKIIFGKGRTDSSKTNKRNNIREQIVISIPKIKTIT